MNFLVTFQQRLYTVSQKSLSTYHRTSVYLESTEWYISHTYKVTSHKKMLEMTLHMLMEMHLQVLSCLHCNNSVWGMFVMNAAQMHSDVWFILHIVFLHAQRTCSLCVVSWTVSLKWKPCHTESCLPLFSSGIYIWKACQLVSTYWELQLAVKLVPEYIHQWGKERKKERKKKSKAQVSHLALGITVSYSMGTLVLSQG